MFVLNYFREYYVDLIGNPGNLCEPDSVLNGPSSISISSPLRFPRTKPVEPTIDFGSLAKQYFSDSQSLNLVFDEASSGNFVVADICFQNLDICIKTHIMNIFHSKYMVHLFVNTQEWYMILIGCLYISVRNFRLPSSRLVSIGALGNCPNLGSLNRLGLTKN